MFKIIIRDVQFLNFIPSKETQCNDTMKIFKILIGKLFFPGQVGQVSSYNQPLQKDFFF